MALGMSLLATALFSAIAWWRANPILFFCSAGCSFVTFYQWGNTYSTAYGRGVSAMFFIYALACLAYGIRVMFNNPGADDET